MIDDRLKNAIELLKSFDNEKTSRDKKDLMLRDFFSNAFEISHADKTKIAKSKKGQQILWKIMQRLQMHDYTIHGTNAPEWKEKLVTDALQTILKLSGLVEAEIGKGGNQQKSLAYGDSFMLFHTVENGFPFRFQVLEKENVYIDSYATTMRGGTRPAQRVAIVVSYSEDEFEALYPDKETESGEEIKGLIQRNVDTRINTLDKKRNTADTSSQDRVEVCHYFDIAEKCYIVFAGSENTILVEKEGEDYPFVFRKGKKAEERAYIPVFHKLAIPSLDGFYNHGIFEMIYDIALADEDIKNGVMFNSKENANPYTIWNVPKGGTGELMKRLKDADNARKQGKKAIVPYEVDLMGGNVSTQPLSNGGTVAQDALIVSDIIDREIKRMGFFLDDTEGQVTATQILADEENATAWVKQYQEINASEFEFMLNVVLDLLPKVVKNNDKTPLHITSRAYISADNMLEIVKKTGTDVALEEVQPMEVSLSDITLGLIADELAKGVFFAKVNRRSGVNTTRLKVAQLQQMLAITPPQSPEFSQITKQLASLRDIDFEEKPQAGNPLADLLGGLQMPKGVPQEAIAEQSTPVASPNDRMTINPRQAQQPIF